MIQHDQPTIFGDSIIAALSSAEDGTMSFARHDQEEIVANRQSFLDRAGIDPFQATLLQVTFEDTTDFTRYKVIDEEHMGEGMLAPISDTQADALVATRPDQAIFLPLADCAGAIMYDPTNRILMVSHLGRHSVEADGGAKSVDFLRAEFESEPAELLVWLSPAVGAESYPMYKFQNRGLHDVIVEQMLRVGVLARNIEVSHVDTADSADYFSHSEFKVGNRPEDGRFAIVAMMVE